MGEPSSPLDCSYEILPCFHNSKTTNYDASLRAKPAGAQRALAPGGLTKSDRTEMFQENIPCSIYVPIYH